MRSGHRYGDNPEIVALSKTLSVNVCLMLHIQGGTKMWIPVGEDKPDSPTFRLVLDYESPNSSLNHYMSLRRVRRERRHETVNDIKIIELDGIVHKLWFDSHIKTGFAHSMVSVENVLHDFLFFWSWTHREHIALI